MNFRFIFQSDVQLFLIKVNYVSHKKATNICMSGKIVAVVRACSSMAEQAAHNRLVVGSNPSGPIFLLTVVS